MTEYDADVVIANVGPSSARNGPRAAAWGKTFKRPDHPCLYVFSEFDGVPSSPDAVRTAMRRAMPDSHWYSGHATHGAREVGLGVWGDRFHVTRHSTYLLTPGSGRSGADQDRWATEVCGKLEEHVLTTFSMHTSTSHPLEALRKVSPMVKAAAKKGSVLLAGDLNTDHQDEVHAWAQSVGLTGSYSTRVMWGLWTPDLKVAAREVSTIGKGVSDHPKQIHLQIGWR